MASPMPTQRVVGSSYFTLPSASTRYPEVLFPNEFTQIHPWGVSPQFVSSQSVHIEKLMHVTHNAEAQDITSMYSDTFTFLPKPKFGKVLGAFDGRPCGESLKFNDINHTFTYISPNETVFPGFYSWWSIYPEQVAGSRYGNQAFICDFIHLLTAYATSRQIDMRKVCIRKGGTLRYTREICYVLIICEERDAVGFPLELVSNKFNTNGLINEAGRICNISATPTFHRNEWFSDGSYESDRSYETVAIAFYFPVHSAQTPFLKVPVYSPPSQDYQGDHYQPAFVTQVPHSYCIKKKRSPSCHGFKCPNELNREQLILKLLLKK